MRARNYWYGKFGTMGYGVKITKSINNVKKKILNLKL